MSVQDLSPASDLVSVLKGLKPIEIAPKASSIRNWLSRSGIKKAHVEKAMTKEGERGITVFEVLIFLFAFAVCGVLIFFIGNPGKEIDVLGVKVLGLAYISIVAGAIRYLAGERLTKAGKRSTFAVMIACLGGFGYFFLDSLPLGRHKFEVVILITGLLAIRSCAGKVSLTSIQAFALTSLWMGCLMWSFPPFYL